MHPQLHLTCETIVSQNRGSRKVHLNGNWGLVGSSPVLGYLSTVRVAGRDRLSRCINRQLRMCISGNARRRMGAPGNETCFVWTWTFNEPFDEEGLWSANRYATVVGEINGSIVGKEFLRFLLLPPPPPLPPPPGEEERQMTDISPHRLAHYGPSYLYIASCQVMTTTMAKRCAAEERIAIGLQLE